MVNQPYQVTTLANSAGYQGSRTRERYEPTDSEVAVDIVDPGNQSLATMEAYAASVCGYPAGNPCLAILASNNLVKVELDDAGTYTEPLGSFPLAGRTSFKMREQAGTLSLQARDDAGTWITLGATSTPRRAAFTDTTLGIAAGSYRPESVSSTVTYDNVNVP